MDLADVEAVTEIAGYGRRGIMLAVTKRPAARARHHWGSQRATSLPSRWWRRRTEGSRVMSIRAAAPRSGDDPAARTAIRS